MTDLTALDRLQAWYSAHCNGEWEHSYGVKIDTLDNPGWSVDIDLKGTELDGRAFDPIRLDNDDEWMLCDVVDGRFTARCSPLKLNDALNIFANFAKSGSDANA